MALFFYFCLGLVWGGTINEFSVSAQNLTITAVTTYKFNLKLVTGISSTGSVSIVFPSAFGSLSQGSYQCSSSQSSACSCSVSGQTLAVSSCFPIKAGVIFELYLNSVNNPKIAKTTSAFQVFTYSDSGTLADSQSNGPTITIKEVTLKKAQILVEGQVSSSSTWTISLELSQEIPTGGFIFLQLPAWSSTLGKAKSSQTSGAFCISVLNCKETLKLNTNLYCECSTSGLNISISQALSTSTTIKFNLNSPPSTSPMFNFFVSTGLSDGFFEKSGNLSVSASSPTGLTIKNFELDSSYTVSDYSGYIFGFTLNSPVPQYAYLILTFPSDFALDSLVSIEGYFGITNPAFSVSGLDVLITNGFADGYIKENTLIYFKANKVRNPYSSKPSDSIVLKIYDKNNAVLALAESGLVVTASPGVLNQVTISPLDTYIDHSTIYTFTFTLTHSLKSGAGVYIVFPDEIIPENYEGTCLYIPENSALSKSSKCLITNNKYLYIVDGMANGNQSSTVSFQVSHIKNPKTTASVSSFFIATCLNSSCTYFIDTQTTTASLKFLPNLISSASVSIDDPVTGKSSSYTFTIVPPSTIPKKSYIEILLPDGISINLSTCMSTSGFNSNINCAYSGTLNVTQGFELGDVSSGTIQFTVHSFVNPPSTRPVSSFKVYIKHAGNLVCYKEDIQIQAQSPHLLKSVKVTAGNYTVGSTTSIQFDIEPFNGIGLSAVRIDQPQDLSIVSASCSGDGVKSCTSTETGKMLVLDSLYRASFSVVLAGVAMPYSTQPTESFKILTFDSTYQVDYLNSSIVLAMNTPGNFMSSKLSVSDTGINKVTSFNFQLKNTNPIPANGYILIMFPVETAFLDPVSCTYSNANNNCVLTSDGLKVVVEKAVYSSYFSIVVNNVINSENAGESSQFIISSFNGLGYQIDQNNGIKTRFTCYSPCSTCENEADNCTSCSSLYYYDNSCHASCKTGFYSSGNFQCQACVSPCLTCSSATECLSCVENRVKYGGSCMENCPDGFYNASNVCKSCSDKCKKCSESQCFECSSGFVYGAVCIDDCTGYSENGYCYDCLDNCQQCSNSTDCEKCKENFILYEGECLKTCPQGKYENNSACEPCESNCISCTSLEACQQCSDSFYLINGVCESSCPLNYYANNGNCEQCETGCETCDESSCINCQDSYLLYNSTCVKSCPAHVTVKVENTCQECSETCLTCANTPNNCISCSDPYFLYQGTCLTSCPSPLIGYSSECVKCEDGCETCQGTPGKCLSCEGQSVLYNGKCLDECPQNITVLSGNACEECSGDCIYCENYTNYCTVCKSGIQYLGSCLESCPTGYYPISGKCTEQCSEGCTPLLLNNSECDPQCNTQSCNYDNYLCEVPNTYITSLQVSETPFPSTIATVSSTGVSGISKYFVPTTSFVSSSVSMMSVTESASWVNLAYQVSQTDYTHGRKLMNSNTKTLLAFSLIICFLVVHFLINFVFVLIYYFQVLAKDEKLKVWSRSHKCANGVIVTMACLVNFKFIKIIVSSIFGFRVCKADFDKRSSLLMPLLVMSYISIVTTSVPIICILVYILSVYSTGNPVFIFALDTLITTCLSTLMLIPDIVQMHKEISGENRVAAPEFLTTYEPEPNKTLKIETFNVCEYHDIDRTCMDTGRSLLVQDPLTSPVNTIAISCQTSQKLFEKVEDNNTDLKIEIFKLDPLIIQDLHQEKEVVKETVETGQNPIPFFAVDQASNTEDLTQVTILKPSEAASFSFERVSFESVQPVPKFDNLKIESVSELWVRPIKTAKKPDSPVDENLEEPQEFEFEILDSSKEYIDEENEPQLLETINEEDELDLSQAEIDQFDFECIKVPHKASGLNVLVKKEFINADLEDGSRLTEDDYEIEKVDEGDVRLAYIKRSNSEAVLKARRHFRGSTIVDVELRGGIWLVGRVVRSENDFDFEHAKVCTDGRTVLVTHNVSGLPFLVYKNFIKAANEDGEELESDPEDLIVDENDVHLGHFNSRTYKRNFVGGLVSALIYSQDSPGSIPTPRLLDQTAFFDSNSNSNPVSDNSESMQFNNSEFLNTFAEGFFVKPDPPVSIEIQTELSHDQNLSLSQVDSINIFPIKIPNVSSVLSVGEPVAPRKQFRKFKKIEEEKHSNNSSKAFRKKNNKKIKSKESSKQGTPKSSRIKGFKKSDSINSNESYKSVQAIYLQRLRQPNDKGEKVLRSTFHTPTNNSKFELSIQMSLNKLQMISASSKQMIDTVVHSK